MNFHPLPKITVIFCFFVYRLGIGGSGTAVQVRSIAQERRNAAIISEDYVI